MTKDILFQMVANKRGGIDPSPAIQSAIIETVNLPHDADCRIELDPNTNQYKVYRYWTTVEDAPEGNSVSDSCPKVESSNQVPLSAARQKNANIQLGDLVSEEINFSRIEFQKFKRLFSIAMHKAERIQMADTYRSRIGEIFIGTVQKQQFGREGLILELEKDVELLLPYDHIIPREEIRLHDRLYVYLYSIDVNAKGPQLLVSRTAPELLKKLLELKILEINSGVIEVKSVARDPGVRAKVAVKTNDGRLNAIGTCIGRSGERIHAISNELNDEHIDIVLWDDNPAQLAINAIAPAEVVSIAVDEDARVMDVAVRHEDLARAIGRNGQNVRLASQITGWTLNIISAKEIEKKNATTFSELEDLFIGKLGLRSTQAKQLIQHGFFSLEDLANAEAKDLARLLKVEDTEIENIQQQANNLLLANAFAAESESLHASHTGKASLSDVEGMTPVILTSLKSHGIDSQDLLAELSIDELLEIISLPRKEAGELIMNARAHWFKKPDTV